MNIFVTGATGYIGHAVVGELVALGHVVTGLVRSDARAELVRQQGAQALVGDIADPATYRDQAAQHEALVHTAFGTGPGAVAADRTIRALHVLGVEIAIDNFGTGYSSLGLVRGFSAQAVKIDRSMVSSCPNKRECAAIVQAVGAMARSLGITVIAGGVETEEERRAVASLGCDRAQGNLIGRPADWARIAKLTVEPPKIPAG